jgi:hypothetical protein
VRLTGCELATTIVARSPTELTLDYPPDGIAYFQDRNEWAKERFPRSPKGFSGGGIFGIMKTKKGDLDIVQYWLVGIQYCWNSQKRCVKAVPMRHWCELVDAECGFKRGSPK